MMRLFTSPRRAAAPSLTRRTGPSALGATSPGTTSSTPSAASTRGGSTCPRHQLASASRANAPPTVRPKRRRSARDAPGMGLEERVDEGRERRSLREHDECAEEGEHEHDRPEPPFLAHTHEAPELSQERYGRGSWHDRLPLAAPRRRCQYPRGRRS